MPPSARLQRLRLEYLSNGSGGTPDDGQCWRNYNASQRGELAMSTLKSIAGAVAALVAASTASYADNCKPAFEFKTVTPGKLTVAIYNYPPFSMVTNDNKISGIDTNMVQETAKA